MGTTRGPYNEEYSVGSQVRIVGETKLKEFHQTWKYHHPLEENQLRYAGRNVRRERGEFLSWWRESYMCSK